ncbi:DUF3131 domain-containing protein [Leucothrix pacifica]|uniref:DUF3131 domain-containing protein n=1 Tax=Leucothrix pacifica TaxID=1247513 RepID=A0A317C6X5_9GAMM|nr:DUF3131 domain-containing protein [Leucothrix pacifica]PWQ94059.1 hypothetical protein DKW60_17300 [Leucothrix pacifica]
MTEQNKNNNSRLKYKRYLPLLIGIVLGVGVIAWTSSKLDSDEGKRSPSEMFASKSDKSAPGMCADPEPSTHACFTAKAGLCKEDLDKAKIAWAYYENNYQPKTGLVNSVNNYTSTTMWDTGSAIAATIAAHDFGLIDQKDFDDRIVALIKTLSSMKLFNDEAPNKVYSTTTGKMVDYRNQPSEEGIGVSTLDLARLVSWMNTLICKYPKFTTHANRVLSRWDYDRLIKNGQMYGLARDAVTKKVRVLQEGRLGYEQYAGKVFEQIGFDQSIAADYENKFRSGMDIYDVPVAFDSRDPRVLGAYNYVVTESYGLDAMEHGYDEVNTPLVRNIFDVQKERWKRTGIVSAISEDNVDRKPYFIYNTIFTAGLPWNTTTDRGVQYNELKSVSTKAAFTMAMLYPDDDYSQVLIEQVESAYDPKKGWYSGVYENGGGYNKATTANTNGIVLSTLLYKKYGSMFEICNACGRQIKLDPSIFKSQQK